MADKEHPPGKHQELHEACKHAYENAKENGGTPPFVVDRIELHGNNPFTEYRFFIRP
jgi:hypothetical protein